MIRHLLVIGAQRCGTTYLHTMLDSHEQITMARPANPEPKVFCSDEATARGAEWYRETYFAHAGDELLLGEKSTSYLEDPERPGAGEGDAGRDPRPRHPARSGEAGHLELALQHGQRAGDAQAWRPR